MNHFHDGPTMGMPWGENRFDLERTAIITSWDEDRQARRLLEFPDSLWGDRIHKTVIKAMRSIAAEGEEINRLSLFNWVFHNAKESLAEYADLEAFASDPQVISTISGLHTQAVKDLRTEYQWECWVNTLKIASSRTRKMPFEKAYDLLRKQVDSLMPSKGEVKSEGFDETIRRVVDDYLNPEAEQSEECFPTGLERLDHALGGGIIPGKKILVVGAPGMGKTTLAFQICANLCMDGVPSLFNQLEMTAATMAKRAIAMSVQKPLLEMSREDWKNAHRMAYVFAPLILQDDHASLEEWSRRSSAFFYKNPDVKIELTDYAGCLQDHGYDVNSTQAANAVSSAWVRNAKRHNVASILLQQPTKAYLEAKQPSPRFIRDSGKFFQDADSVWFIHYPHYFDKSWPDDYTQVHMLKNRDGRMGEIIHLRWRADRFSMQSWTGELPKSGQPNTVPEMEDLDW